MRAILIDPYDHTVTEIIIEGNNLQEIYKILDVQVIDAARIALDDVVYVDDEGLLKGPTNFFAITGETPNPIAGRGLLVGTTPSGHDTDPRHSLAQITAQVRFYILMHTGIGNRFFEVPHAERGRAQ